jgi:hypothetical protein
MTTADSPPLFDRLRYVDRLTSAGIGADQARAHADAMEDALRAGVATKGDLNALGTELRTAIATLRTEMLAIEYRLTVRGGLMAAAVVAILASLKFF